MDQLWGIGALVSRDWPYYSCSTPRVQHELQLPSPPPQRHAARYLPTPEKHKAIGYSYTYIAIGCLARARH